jgi:hypothetical protein
MYAMLFFIALDLLIMGLGISSRPVLIVAVIIGGGFLGVNNTLITTAVMEASPVERPVASAAYSFIRFLRRGGRPLPRRQAGRVVRSERPVLRGGRRRCCQHRGPPLRTFVSQDGIATIRTAPPPSQTCPAIAENAPYSGTMTKVIRIYKTVSVSIIKEGSRVQDSDIQRPGARTR